MKSLLFVLALLAVLLPLKNLDAQQKTDAELLEETIKLSKEVKEFGKTIGIEPTEALSKGEKERKPSSMLWIWVIKKGIIKDEPEITIQAEFSTDKENVRLYKVFSWNSDYSAFWRVENEFAGAVSAAITPSFLKNYVTRQVMVTIHEDLHGNFELDEKAEEAMVTPLGYLVAMEFFKSKQDTENFHKAKNAIAGIQEMCQQLNTIAKKAKIIFETVPLNEARKEVLKLISANQSYFGWYSYNAYGATSEDAMEAKLSHDIMYWEFFDKVIRLYELAPDLKTLIIDLKLSPGNRPGVRKYLDELGQKYSAAK